MKNSVHLWLLKTNEKNILKPENPPIILSIKKYFTHLFPLFSYFCRLCLLFTSIYRHYNYRNIELILTLYFTDWRNNIQNCGPVKLRIFYLNIILAFTTAYLFLGLNPSLVIVLNCILPLKLKIQQHLYHT